MNLGDEDRHAGHKDEITLTTTDILEGDHAW